MASEGLRELEQVYSWLPRAALQVFMNEWVANGNEDAAMAAVRADERYEQWFPGNLTDDGRPRYGEDAYAAVIAAYDDIFRSVELDPVLFQGQYGALIRGDVSPQELLQDRVTPLYERIIEGSSSVKAEYARMYGLYLTDEALLASLLDPELGSKVLAGQITMAEISGEGVESGYRVSQDLVQRLYRAGVDQEGADELFMGAENIQPVLNVLASRHADPDDEFDLEDFVSADIFQDPLQRRRMRRLLAQERATFTGGSLGGFAESRSGNVAGLHRPV